MSLSRIDRRALLGGALLLAGCGYQPVYRNSAARRVLVDRIAVDAPQNPREFVFVRHLEQTLGRPDTPGYQLAWSLNTRQNSVGAAAGQRSTRININGTADYTLLDIDSGAVVARGSTDAFTGYTATSVSAGGKPSNTNAQLAEIASARDATERLMVILADQILSELIAFAGSLKA